MSDTCVKHSFETATGVCRQCRNSYCAECLVYAFGDKKPPYCVTCALNVAGVRQTGARPNPRLRKKGLFRRKVLVEEAPREELGFDDIQIGLPEEAYSAPVMTRAAPREVAPEILATVDPTGAAGAMPHDTAPGSVAVASPPEGPADSLADWAASLSPEEPAPASAASEPWAEARKSSASFDGWPDD